MMANDPDQQMKEEKQRFATKLKARATIIEMKREDMIEAGNKPGQTKLFR